MTRLYTDRSHQHVSEDITDLGGGSPGPHTHPESDITNLLTDLAGKAASVHTHAQSSVTNLVTDLLNKADTVHGHAQSEVTNLVTDLAGKAAVSHPHAQADVTNLVSDLASKQAALVSGTTIKTVNGTSLLGSGDLVIAGGGSSYHFVGTLAGNQATGANVTPVTLTGLVFSYAINSTYRLWFMGRVQPGAATTGCGFQFDLSSAVTAINVVFEHQLANTGTMSGGHSIGDDASVGVSSGLPATSTYPVIGNGLLVTGANTGTAQLRFRSETTAVITALAGMTLVVEKVA